MLKDLPDINMHFHAHAACYRGGDIVFLIDGSAKMVAAHDGKALRDIIECADVIRNKLNRRTRAFYYGTEDGLEEIDLHRPAMVTAAFAQAHGTKECMLQPAIRDIAALPDSSPEHPLHLIIVSGGDNNDPRFGQTHHAIRNLLEKPGTQVMLDVILAAKPYANFMRLVGPAMSHMLDGGKCKHADKAAPMIYTAFENGQMGCALTDAINQRTAPENPHRFMVDIVCDIFRQGAPAGMTCPPRAVFKKRPR